MTKQYKANVKQQGKAVLSKYAYVAKESDDIICMYLDAWGETGMAYPEASGQSYDHDTGNEWPSIWFSATDDDNEEYTLVNFPELIGWKVFALGGGETCAIVLTKGVLFE